NGTEDRPVVTSAFSGKPARGVENKFIAEMKQHEHDLPGYPIQITLTKDIRKAAAEQNKPEYMSLWSGQNTRLSRNINAEGIIEYIVKEMNELALSEVLHRDVKGSALNRCLSVTNCMNY